MKFHRRDDWRCGNDAFSEEDVKIVIVTLKNIQAFLNAA